MNAHSLNRSLIAGLLGICAVIGPIAAVAVAIDQPTTAAPVARDTSRLVAASQAGVGPDARSDSGIPASTLSAAVPPWFAERPVPRFADRPVPRVFAPVVRLWLKAHTAPHSLLPGSWPVPRMWFKK